MNLNKYFIQVSVENKDIQIVGKTFDLKVNFDDLSFLHMNHEQEVYAAEMEIDVAKVKEFHPEFENKIRIAMHTPQISCEFTADRDQADKIARGNHDRFKQIMLGATPLNFHEEHNELLKKLQNEDDAEEMSYPVHFHACGHSFGKDEDDEDDSSMLGEDFTAALKSASEEEKENAL